MAKTISDLDRDIKVLIVDDFSTMRRIVKGLLERCGYCNFIEAENGLSAFQTLQTEKVDLIVSDWNMPHMMGIDLLKAVRADEQLKDIPFLMVTAESNQENVMQAVQAGVSNYIVKPFTQDTMEKKLLQIFRDR